jgi:hypothetical protein
VGEKGDVENCISLFHPSFPLPDPRGSERGKHAGAFVRRRGAMRIDNVKESPAAAQAGAGGPYRGLQRRLEHYANKI